jgi:serine/threonine protein kinase
MKAEEDYEFDFVRVISSGGFGCVFLMTRRADGKSVVVKYQSHTTLSDREVALQRMLHEAAPLLVPEIIRSVHQEGPMDPLYVSIAEESQCDYLLDEWRRETKFHFVVSEYIDGGEVCGPDLIGAREVNEYLLCIGYVLREGWRLCHFIHSDIKSANILHRTGVTERVVLGEFSFVPRHGRIPVLIDFGISYDGEMPYETRGTTAYFPPEMLLHPTSGHLRMDMWALALTIVGRRNLNCINVDHPLWKEGEHVMHEFMKHNRTGHVRSVEVDTLLSTYVLQYGMGNGMRHNMEHMSDREKTAIESAVLSTGMKEGAILINLKKRLMHPQTIVILQKMLAWTPVWTYWRDLLKEPAFQPYLTKK